MNINKIDIRFSEEYILLWKHLQKMEINIILWEVDLRRGIYTIFIWSWWLITISFIFFGSNIFPYLLIFPLYEDRFIVLLKGLFSGVRMREREFHSKWRRRWIMELDSSTLIDVGDCFHFAEKKISMGKHVFG